MNEQAPTVEATTPTTKEALRVVLVDQSKDAHDEARDRADARLDRELGEGGKIKQFLNGIWKGNLAKDFYRQKYVSEALTTIEDANTVHAEAPAERRTRAIEATIARFSSEYDEVIHEDAGEKREVQDETSPLARGVKRLIHDFVEGRLDADTLGEERTRLLNEYRREHGEQAMGEGIVTTDNLLSIAQTVAGVVEHGESLDYALGRLEVITGEAREGARTEALYTAADKAIDWLSKRKIASFATPGALATGVAAGMAIARVTGHGVVGAVTKTLIPGAAAGAWAALRENKRTKDERAQHSREMAVGEEFNEGDKRREAMEATRYESVSAVDLIASLQEAGNAESLDAGGNDALQAALDALAAAQARVDISDKKKIDLISYSSKTDVGEERMMLDLARREARLSLEQRLTAEARAALNLGPQASVRGLIEQRSLLFQRVLTEGDEEHEGIDAKDAAFAKLKRTRVAKAAAIGVATGVVGGLVAQEAVAAFDSTRFGLIDAIRGNTPELYNGEVHQTILEGFVRGDETTVHTDPSTTYESHTTAGSGSLELSDDHSLETNDDGTFNLVDPNGNRSVEGLVTDAQGTLDESSLQKLEDAGMVVEDRSYDETVTTTSTEQVSTNQYIQNHLAETTAATRDLWYGNDTSVYDQNELRVYRGGSDAAPGIVDGGYQYTVAGMTADGSYQNGESVNWSQSAANGELFVAVSGTFDTQGNPFMIPIGPDGAVNIPADSPAGQFFANENNSVTFNGAYMEIVQSTGQDAEGVTHIRPLATLVGDTSVDTINDTVTTESIVHHAEYTITSNGYDTVQQNATEVAPITPIASRRSMEALKVEDTPELPGGYYSSEVSDAERERIRAESSPRLQANPDATLELGQEADWYRQELIRTRGEDYVRELEAFADNDPALRTLSNNTEAIVTIPVAAAYEADNIYGTLSLYAQQNPEGVAKSTILLNLNWLDTAIDDPAKVEAIRKTIAEVERAKQDFPQLSIAAIQKEYNEAEVTATGGIIGYVASDLVNTVLVAAQRRVATGDMESTHDFVMVRADADARGVARNQLRNFQKAVAENQQLDVVKGATRFGVEEQGRFPAYGIVSTFMSAFQILGTQENDVHTGGANFGVRVSTLAAIGGLGDITARNADGEPTGYTGAGSDDVAIGRRVTAVRNLKRKARGYTADTYGSSQASDPGAAKRIKLVAGAAVDTSADRLLAAHLVGENIQSVWNPELEKGFAAGPGNYRPRDTDASIIENAPKQDFDGPEVYTLIEEAMSFELQISSEAVGRKALGMLFGSVAAAYTIEGELGTAKAHFKLTQAGRDFIKNRVQRETNGRFGAYGARKRRQLYGEVSPTAKRLPASQAPPLVSPIVTR